MAKRKPMKLPDSFYALFDYLRSRGYAENSVFEYESHARWITKFMQDNGYEFDDPTSMTHTLRL